MSLQRTVGCDGLVMFLGCLWTGYRNLPWDVLQLERGKEAGQEPPGGEQWWKSWRRWNLHGAKRRPKGETLAKAKDRVEWRRLIAALHQGWRDWVSELWRIQGRGRGPSFLIFRPNGGPRGRKNFFWDRVSSLISRSGWPPPLPHLKVWSATGEWVSKPFPNGDRLIQVRL